MRKSIIVVALAAMLAVAFAGCGSNGGSASSSASSASSSASSSSASSSSGSASSSASSASSSASSGASQAQGTPQITMGSHGLIDVHETSEGVGADVVVEVTNTGNVPLIMSNPTIKIANESGTVIVDQADDGVMTGPTYLRVGDTAFIYSNGPLMLPDGYFPGYNYLAQGSADLKACKEVYEYPLSNVRLSEDSQGVPTLWGTVTNDDTEQANLIEVSVVYSDNRGELLGVAKTVVVDLAPGESADFSIDGYTLPVPCTMAVIANHDEIAVAPKY